MKLIAAWFAVFAGVATRVLATTDLTNLAAVVGIVGGIAGIYSLWRVSRLADGINEFLTAQSGRIDELIDGEPPEEPG